MGGPVHVSLKIIQSFHVNSSSSFTTFCVMAKKSQFTDLASRVITMVNHGLRMVSKSRSFHKKENSHFTFHTK